MSQGHHEKEKAVQFTRPDQVAEILNEANRLKLQILLRYANDGKAVRAVLEAFDAASGSIRLGGISPAGDALLKPYDIVRAEFILLSKKLIFSSGIRARAPGKLVLSTPEKLVAIERRSNQRFRVTAACSAFVEFPEKRVDVTRIDAPFFPEWIRDGEFINARFRVDDISLGGAACFTRFAALLRTIKTDEISTNAVIYFPGSGIIHVPVNVRWTKKTTTALADGRFLEMRKTLGQRLKGVPGLGNPSYSETFFRIGIQFAEVSRELDSALRAYIRLLQTEDSV